MATASPTNRAELARDWARTARDSFTDAAQYLRSVPAEEWSAPSACARWTIRDLAGHTVGEAVWFPNLVRGATRGEEPYPAQLYEDLKHLPEEEICDRIEASAAEIEFAVAEATPDGLEKEVDLGFAKMPVWQATYISAFEGVFHNWDARAARDANAKVPTDWALQIVPSLRQMVPFVAHRKALAGAQGTYLLQVDDGIGPVTITVQGEDVSARRGAAGTPDVTLHLDADQCARLIVGRFKLDSEQGREVRIDGDREKAAGLNRVFAGVANDE